MSEIAIPPGHWAESANKVHNAQAFIPGWELQLRKVVANEPDPAVRFGAWLRMDMGRPGPRIVFIEQPWLSLAEEVERLVERTERRVREVIAYEVANPDER